MNGGDEDERQKGSLKKHISKAHIFCFHGLLVLEIGCFTGYSALAFAQALQDVPGAEVEYTIPPLTLTSPTLVKLNPKTNHMHR